MRVVYQLCFLIRFRSFFWSVKISNQFLNAVSAYSRSPTFTCVVPRHSKKSTFVSFMRRPLVLNVLRRSYIAQIRKSIVCWVSVNMVNIMQRGFICHVKPCKSMGAETFAIQTYYAVFIRSYKTSYRFFSSSFTRYFPCKNTCAGVIMQTVMQTFSSGKFNVSNYNIKT